MDDLVDAGEHALIYSPYTWYVRLCVDVHVRTVSMYNCRCMMIWFAAVTSPLTIRATVQGELSSVVLFSRVLSDPCWYEELNSDYQPLNNKTNRNYSLFARKLGEVQIHLRARQEHCRLGLTPIQLECPGRL